MNNLSVVVFIWLLEPVGFSVMLPKGINTPLKKLTKKQIKPVRLMEFILYPGLLTYMVISTYEAGVNGFWNLFWTAYIENLFRDYGPLGKRTNCLYTFVTYSSRDWYIDSITSAC